MIKLANFSTRSQRSTTSFRNHSPPCNPIYFFEISNVPPSVGYLVHLVHESSTRPRKTTPPPPIKKDSPRRASRSPEKKQEPLQEEQASYPSNNEPSQRKPYVGLQDFPVQLPDYHSPYAYRGQRAQQDRNVNQTSFPAVPSNRKTRPPLHEPRYRAEPIHYHGQSKAISLVGNALFPSFFAHTWCSLSLLGEKSCPNQSRLDPLGQRRSDTN